MTAICIALGISYLVFGQGMPLSSVNGWVCFLAVLGELCNVEELNSEASCFEFVNSILHQTHHFGG